MGDVYRADLNLFITPGYFFIYPYFILSDLGQISGQTLNFAGIKSFETHRQVCLIFELGQLKFHTKQMIIKFTNQKLLIN